MDGKTLLFVLAITGALWVVPPSFVATVVASIAVIFAVESVAAFIIAQTRIKSVGPPAPGNSSFALVTGASRGMGRCFCSQLAAAGYNIVAVARSDADLKELKAELEKAHDVQVLTIDMDLAAPQAAAHLHERVSKIKSVNVDILIANAGVAYNKRVVSSELSRLSLMIDLNVKSATELMYLYAKDMVKKKSGRIMAVSSITSACPQPMEAVYGATKAYLSSFTIALGYELQKSGVSVTCLQPGATITDFARNSGCDTSLIFKLPGSAMEADAVVKTACDALLCDSPPAVVTPGFMNKLITFSGATHPLQLLMFICELMWAPAGGSRKKNLPPKNKSQ